MFCKKGVLRNFAKSNCLRPATLLKKKLWHRCFPVNLTKFLRTPFLTEHLCSLKLDIGFLFRITKKTYDLLWSMVKKMFIYFLIRLAQTKITLFIFWNNWVIKENANFLLVEVCPRVPKSRAMGEYHVKFLRLTTMILDLFWHNWILSNSTVWNRFVYLFVLCASRISCLYLSLWKWIPLIFGIFLRGPADI